MTRIYTIRGGFEMVRIRITKRDEDIKKFLNEVVIADTKTLSILFFEDSIRGAQKRLKMLVDNDYIRCFRETVWEQNLYYSRQRPRNWKHKIVFSQLLGKLKQLDLEVLKYKSAYKIANIIADGLIIIRVNEEVKIYFVEIERTKKLNTDKYIELYYSRSYKEFFPVMPSILLITDNNYKEDTILDIVKVDYNLNNLKNISL